MKPTTLLLSILFSTTLILTGCNKDPDASSNNESTPNIDATNINETNTNSQVHWQSCNTLAFSDWFPEYEPYETLQCATIHLPIEHTANQTDTTASAKPSTMINLAVSRLPATGTPEEKLGTLIIISGGPGQSSIDIYPNDTKAFNKISKHFDIIGYAPRGIAPTTPSINCDNDIDYLDPKGAEKYTTACWEQTPHNLLAVLGAEYAINDVEAIRQAIGDPKISLLSYSYGTKIAALYAESYPEHLRAAVLDGIVNLNEPDLTMLFNQHTSMQHSFERFVADCQHQPDCYFKDTTNLVEAEAKMAKLFNDIESLSVYDFDGDRILPETVASEVMGLLMWKEEWPYLNELLLALDDRDFELLNQLIDISKSSIDEDAFGVINCADVAPNDTQKQTYVKNVRQLNKQSTWDNYRPFTDNEILDFCYYWPIVGSDVTHAPKLAPTAPPLLLVAQTHDPATPYKNAVAMQQYLDAVLLTRQGDGHTIVLTDTSPSIDNKVVDYLMNPDNYKNLKNKKLYSKD